MNIAGINQSETRTRWRKSTRQIGIGWTRDAFISREPLKRFRWWRNLKLASLSMVWLTSPPAWAPVVFCVGLSVLAAIASRVLLRAFIPATQGEMAYSIAAPIMTALAAGFAVLMALTVANAAAYLSSAQSIVNSEAATLPV
jgi:hypothetical protein